MIVYVEGLEDRLPEIRSGACAALAILEVYFLYFRNMPMLKTRTQMTYIAVMHKIHIYIFYSKFHNLASVY